MARFKGLNTQVLGISIDHVPSLQAWAESLDGIEYPLLSDFWPHGKVIRRYGVLRQEGYSERAIFVIDREGRIRYIDIHDIDEQPDNDELLKVIRDIDPQAAAEAAADPGELENAPVELPKGGIVLYCTTWCPDCRRARNWLQGRGLAYQDVDVDAVPGAADQVRQWANGYKTTPTFDIDGEIIVGFNIPALEKALGVRLGA